MCKFVWKHKKRLPHKISRSLTLHIDYICFVFVCMKGEYFPRTPHGKRHDGWFASLLNVFAKRNKSTQRTNREQKTKHPKQNPCKISSFCCSLLLGVEQTHQPAPIQRFYQYHCGGRVLWERTKRTIDYINFRNLSTWRYIHWFGCSSGRLHRYHCYRHQCGATDHNFRILRRSKLKWKSRESGQRE